MKRYAKKTILHAAFAVSLATLIGGAIYLKSVFDYQQAVADLSPQEINLSAVPNGTYAGSCDVNFVAATVLVTVNGGKITSIEIIDHKNERGQPAEQIIQQIVSEQKITVDTVSGATNSSKVLQKAVENALRNQAAV